MKKVWAEEMPGDDWEEDSWDDEDDSDRKPAPININLPFITESRYGKVLPAVIAILLIPIIIGSSTQMGTNTWYEVDDDDDDIRKYSADVNLTNDVLLDSSTTVDEGESVEYDHNSTELNVLMMEVDFSWDSIDNDVGAPDVRLEVWSDDESRDPIVFTDTAFTGSTSVQWFVNFDENLTKDSFTVDVNSKKALQERFETVFHHFYVRATYEDANNPGFIYQERLEFSLTVTKVTWQLENVEKVWSS